VAQPNVVVARAFCCRSAAAALRCAAELMARAPFQVIVLLFIGEADSRRYAVFKRAERDMWQAVSGGGENQETPAQAAARETLEETGVDADSRFIALDSRASIPASFFSGTEHWPRTLFVVPEYAFGLALTNSAVRLSDEHDEVAWLPFPEAYERLTWDSNKVALWELEQRLRMIDEGASPT
jgi:dihydroneopterin triphosphate diphosphatase